MTYRQLWSEMADRMGTRRPILTARPIPEWIAGAAGDLWALVAGEGDVNSAAVRMSAAYHWHDSSRARSELGYKNRPSAESLDASADWIKRYHR